MASTGADRRGVGKVCLLTGGSAGLGRAAAFRLAAEGFHLFLACRNEAKTAALIAEIKAATPDATVEFLPLDLDSLASTRRCAERFLARNLPLHLLVANAGLGITGLTEDGFERQFQVNYLGHFLLVALLLDRLRTTAADAKASSPSDPVRIVLVSSIAYGLVGDVNYDDARRAAGWGRSFFRMASSKLAMMWHMLELVRRLEGERVVVIAINPGPVATDFPASAQFSRIFQWLIKKLAMTPDAAVKNIVDPAILPAYGSATGVYYDQLHLTALNAVGSDRERARKLWIQSEIWTGLQ